MMYDPCSSSSSSSVPGNVPFPLHQQVNFFNAAVVGVVQSFRQMLLHIRLEVLVCLPTLQQITVQQWQKEGQLHVCITDFMIITVYYINA